MPEPGMAEPRMAAGDPGTRRYVVVIFSDLCDYTLLSERHDPEEVEGLRRNIERCILDVVLEHGGAVSQVYGDGILAVFGVPSPRETDARHAIEAALEMHAAVRSGGFGAFEARLHTGVHAGLVFVREGDILHGKYDLTGDAVNTAARLCAAARRDEILVSRVVLSGVEGFFATDAGYEPLQLKGKALPVPALRVMARSAAQTPFEARARRGMATFVGRERELALLGEALERARAGSEQLWMVAAPAGVGKTRLLDRVRESGGAQGFVALYGSCQGIGDAIALEPFSQVCRSALDVAPDHSLDEARAAVGARLGSLGIEGSAASVDVLARLCVRPGVAAQGPDAPGSVQLAVGSLLCALARQRPLLLLLDDWQSADDVSRQVLEATLQSLKGHSVCTIIGTRAAELLDPLVLRARLIELLPFTEDESDSMVRSFHSHLRDPSGTSVLHRHSGGNALFLEELCRSLPADMDYDEHALARLGTPSTVQGVIQARVAALPAPEMQVLRVAAVIGEEFSSATLAPFVDASDLPRALASLCDAGLVHYTEREGAYRFGHGITRHVVYESVRIAERRHIHESIASRIECELPNERLAEQAELLAYHYRGSGDSARAARFSEVAGDKALTTSALDRARFHFEIALIELDRLPTSARLKERWVSISLRWSLACVYSPAASQLPLHERAVVYADELGELTHRVQTRSALGWIYYALGRYAEAARHAEEARPLAEQSQSPKLCAQVWAALGHTYAASGRYEAALEQMSRSIELKRGRAGESRGALMMAFSYTLACRGSIHAQRGDFGLADADLAEARGMTLGSGHAVEGSVFALQAMSEAYRGEFAACLEAASYSRKVAERVNSLYVFPTATAYEAYANLKLEPTPLALSRLRDAVTLLEQRGHALFLSVAHGFLADALLGSGDLDAAEAVARRALVRASEGDILGQAAAQRCLAVLHAKRRERREAARWLELAEAAGAALGSPRELALTRLLRLELGLADAARDASAPALRDEFARRGMPAFAERAARLMAA